MKSFKPPSPPKKPPPPPSQPIIPPSNLKPPPPPPVNSNSSYYAAEQDDIYNVSMWNEDPMEGVEATPGSWEPYQQYGFFDDFTYGGSYEGY